MQTAEELDGKRIFDTDRRPVDRVALRVVMPGIKYELPESVLSKSTIHSDTPLPMRPETRMERLDPGFVDLTGTRFGSFTVVGIYDGSKMRFVVRCCCGAYELRTARAIRNPNNNKDCCYACQRKRTRNRHYEYITTGRNFLY